LPKASHGNIPFHLCRPSDGFRVALDGTEHFCSKTVKVRSHERARPFTGNTLATLIDAAGNQARMRFLEFFTTAWSRPSESRMNSGRATAVVPSLAGHQTSRIGVDSKWQRKNPPRPELAESHEVPKKQAEAILSDMVGLIAKHLKKGNRLRLVGLGILQVRQGAPQGDCFSCLSTDVLRP